LGCAGHGFFKIERYLSQIPKAESRRDPADQVLYEKRTEVFAAWRYSPIA